MTVKDASDIRAALSSSAVSLKLHLPEGTTYRLGGAHLLVHRKRVAFYSEGTGAILDAGGLSRHFDVAYGGALALDRVHLTNGGLVRVRIHAVTNTASLCDTAVCSILPCVRSAVCKDGAAVQVRHGGTLSFRDGNITNCSAHGASFRQLNYVQDDDAVRP